VAAWFGPWPRFIVEQCASYALGALAISVLAHFAIGRAARAPIEEPSPPRADEGDSVFSAVAVTRTTYAILAALALAPVLFLTAALRVPMSDAACGAALAAYIAAAFGSIAALRRASRIRVGVDGVYVTGAGRARFFAWTGVDDVRAEGADIVLSRRGRAVLRLQLDRAEVARKDALVARVTASLTAAERAGSDPTHASVAHAASGDRGLLARSARGAVDYRQPAIKRETLWEIVEGPGAEPSARMSAAGALAAEMHADERARLRIAAEQCAEPRVRVALEALAERAADAEAEEDATTAETGPPGLTPQAAALARRVRR
jgi:hypothetical protein